MSKIPVLFRNRHFLAVHKPPGINSQPGVPNHPTVLGLLQIQYPKLFAPKADPFHEPKLVHRLDRPVTGALLLGTSVLGTRTLAKRFKEGTIGKLYHAIVPQISSRATEGTITLGNSVTTYKVLLTDYRYSLLSLIPKTGKKHQLREFCAKWLQAPVLGDKLFGSSIALPDGKIALHCSSMRFPFGLETIVISAEPRKEDGIFHVYGHSRWWKNNYGRLP
ncbi:Ribosomal large subunit pseudouridine synthase D [Neolecta irregularis DAH-3]|uniref:21S rRNA pseudouridine(2819) synthase n=1 Tax=Neolecta irregularis (strain DAH-3) TaxID=1198029 RepID=A0A1U7LK35_NEOID|nr:Ribosomal large subunit pseudouridine synthase D [Neolecta irregularis DAH-3]|eukprot:OLL23026.1 Ribosomal large subunit pseudouridine synthase D [Neolecta irregularis DAH-3]